MWHDLLMDTTDAYARRNQLRFPGGKIRASEEDVTIPPLWVTKDGVDVAMLHQYYIAHRIHDATGAAHADPYVAQVKVVPFRFVRKQRKVG